MIDRFASSVPLLVRTGGHLPYGSITVLRKVLGTLLVSSPSQLPWIKEHQTSFEF